MTVTEKLKAQLKQAGLVAHAEGHSKHAVGIPTNVWIDVFESDPNTPADKSRMVHIGFSVDNDEDEFVIVGCLEADGRFNIDSVEERGI